MVVHAFSPSRADIQTCEFKANLVYMVSSRPAGAIERDSVSNQTKPKQRGSVEPEVVAQACNPGALGAKEEANVSLRPVLYGAPGHRGCIARLCLK